MATERRPLSRVDELRAALRGEPAPSAAFAAARTVVSAAPGVLTPDFPAVLATRGDPLARYAAAWSLYLAQGASAAAGVADMATDDLPPAWAANVRFVRATADMLDHRPELWFGGPASLSLDTHFGLPVATVVVNGRAGRFVVDTGAPTTVLTPGFASAATVVTAPSAARTVRDGSGHELTATPAVADQVAAGGAGRSPCAVTILDLPRELGVDGLLSPWDLARGQEVRVELPRTIAFRSSCDGPRGPIGALRWVDGTPRTVVHADGEQVLALLDTGAGMTVIAEHRANRALARPAEGICAGGAVPLRQAGLVHLAGSGWHARLPSVFKRSLADPWALLSEPTDLILGVPWWRNRTVVFPADRASVVLA